MLPSTMAVGRSVVSDDPVQAPPYATEILLHSFENFNCTDAYGNVVTDGMQYVPDDDPCRTCHCHNGIPVMCKSVQCSPPTCRFVEMIKTECCRFICIDLPFDRNGTRFIEPTRDPTPTNFGVRLVASIVTSLIVIFLLVFMVHRLMRRRRTVINIRRLNTERQSENDDLVYMTNAEHMDVGFVLPPYEDLPPPYSPAKPWDISEESPPPYESNSTLNEGSITTSCRVDAEQRDICTADLFQNDLLSTDSIQHQNLPHGTNSIQYHQTSGIECFVGMTHKVCDISQYFNVQSPVGCSQTESVSLKTIITMLENGSLTSKLVRNSFTQVSTNENKNMSTPLGTTYPSQNAPKNQLCNILDESVSTRCYLFNLHRS